MKTKYIGIGAAAFVIYAAAVILSGARVGLFGIDWDFENSGQFGDSFGPLSAIFSCAAAICAFLAYRSQAEEVERIKLSAEIDRASIYRRDFESTFFKLLEIVRDSVRDVGYEHGKKYSGIDAFEKMIYVLWNSDGVCPPDFMRKRYSELYTHNKSDLPHYFRMCYHLVRFINDSEIEDKVTYIRIFRATLSNPEMILLGLNIIYGGGQEKFKPLVENHALLHNISSGDAIRLSIFGHIEERAFGDRDIMKDNSN